MFDNQMYEIVEFNYLNLDLKNKTTGQIKIVCPFCKDNRTHKFDKSLSVNITIGVYNCHHCGKTGNIHKWRKKGTRKIYVKPVWSNKNKTELSDKVIKWFEGRGISQNTLSKMRITEEREWMPQTEKEENCIVFNYFYEDKLINKKFRDGRKNFKLVKDAEKILYNIDAIINAKKAIITEGCIDTLSYVEAGLDYVASVPNGANTNTDYLDNYMPLLDNLEEIYLATDNDTNGLILRGELLRRFGAYRCYKVDFEDCKDANEYLVKYGKEALVNTILNAQKFPIEGLIKVEDIEEELNDLYENGIGEGNKIGDKYIDEMFRIELGRLMVLTSIPSHGKTTLMNYISALINFNLGWKIGFFSPESQPIKLHATKIEELLIGKRFFGDNKMSLQDHQKAMQYLNNNFYFIKPEKRTLDNVLSIAKQAIRCMGIKVVIIDPWNRLEGMSNDTDDIGNELNKVSNFASDNDVLVIIIAHPKKLNKDKNTLLYDEPTPYDIKGSSCWYDKPDYILTYYRDFKTMISTLRLFKLRESYLGKMGGIIKFRYNINNQRFSCVEDVNGMPVKLEWDNTNWLTGEGKIDINDMGRIDYLKSVSVEEEVGLSDEPPF